MTPPSSFPVAPSSPVTVQRSTWHSPVPYLFGGLAAMMGLIAFALLILACSYWKLSRNLHAADGDLEARDGDGDVKTDNKKIPIVFEEMCLVVMAGEEKPTFLATASSSRTSSFGSNSCPSGSTTSYVDDSLESEMEKDERGDQVRVSPMESRESA